MFSRRSQDERGVLRTAVLLRHLRGAATTSRRKAFLQDKTARLPSLLSSIATASSFTLDGEGGSDDLSLPIFVLLPALPSAEEQLHIFEPRYRLLLQHCMETTGPAGQVGEFGMCWPTANGLYSNVGTLLRVESHSTLPDGRSDVRCIAVRRFFVIARGSNRGVETSTNTVATYNTATIRWFEDEDEHDGSKQLGTSLPNSVSSRTGAAVEARNQLVRLHDMLLRAYPEPEAKALLLRMHGIEQYKEISDSLDTSQSMKITISAPDDDSSLSWWLLNRLVKLPPDLKASLVVSRSPTERLLHAVTLLESLQEVYSNDMPFGIELVTNDADK